MGVVLSDSVRGPKQAQPVLTLDAIRLCQELPKLVRELVPKLGFARSDSVRRCWGAESCLTPVLNLVHEHATIMPHRLPGPLPHGFQTDTEEDVTVRPLKDPSPDVVRLGIGEVRLVNASGLRKYPDVYAIPMNKVTSEGSFGDESCRR
jgi:hypothetical protein